MEVTTVAIYAKQLGAQGLTAEYSYYADHILGAVAYRKDALAEFGAEA